MPSVKAKARVFPKNPGFSRRKRTVPQNQEALDLRSKQPRKILVGEPIEIVHQDRVSADRPMSVLTAEQMENIRREMPKAVEYANKKPEQATAFFNKFKDEEIRRARLAEINQRITAVFSSVPWQPQLTNPSPHHRDSRLKTPANLYEDYMKAFAMEKAVLERSLAEQSEAIPEKRKALRRQLRHNLLNPFRLLNPFKWSDFFKQYREYRYLKKSHKANLKGAPAYHKAIEKAQKELSLLFNKIQAEDWEHKATEATVRKAEEYRAEFMRIVNEFYKAREEFGYQNLGRGYAKKMARKAERMQIGTTAELRKTAEQSLLRERKPLFLKRKKKSAPEESLEAESESPE
ncbi:MAG: hypothetical protein QXK06_03990 [Candidatus Diapherotrites archaeon]